MDGIKNAQAKLAWAQAHVKLLDFEIEKVLESRLYTLTAGEDLEHVESLRPLASSSSPSPVIAMVPCRP
jgi:hypothetical protein